MSLTAYLIPTGLALLILSAVLLVQGGAAEPPGEAVLLGGNPGNSGGGVRGVDGVHHPAAVRGGRGL